MKAELLARITRLERAHLPGGRTAADAACYFDAMCEGLADIELRRTLPPGEEGRIWRDALGAFVAGLAIPTVPERLRSDTTERR